MEGQKSFDSGVQLQFSPTTGVITFLKPP